MRTLLLLTLMATNTWAAYTICGPADNDLAAALPPDEVIRAQTLQEAIEKAHHGSAVLVLGHDVSKEFFDRAQAKRLRMYVECPATPTAKTAKWERGVVATDFFGQQLPPMRIVQLHDCRFVAPPVAGKTHLTLARVAGYDSAVYGLPAEQFPLLVETGDGALIATTRLSEFVKARYAPAAEWRIFWRAILKHLDPKRDPPLLNIEPIVRP